MTRAWKQSIASKGGVFGGVAVCTLMLAACSSGPTAPNPGLKESFHTEVSANGSKRFTYALEMATPAMPTPYTKSPATRGGMISREELARQQRRGRAAPFDFDSAVELKLRESGFCRDGYFVIERVVSRVGGELRGECRDPAERP